MEHATKVIISHIFFGALTVGVAIAAVETFKYKPNPTIKLSRAEKDILVSLLDGKQPVYVSEDYRMKLSELIYKGLIKPDQYGEEYELTESGLEIAHSEKSLKDQARKKANLAARGRGEAAKSVGLKKTRFGWE